MPLRPGFVLLAACTAIGCATAPPVPKDTGQVAFALERDLAGATTARGEFSTITGVHRGFTARLTGTSDGDIFVLHEDFIYDDGEKDSKTWRLTRTGDGVYSGTREDVVGTAHCWQDGQVFRLNYLVRLPGKAGKPGRKVRFQDVMAKTYDSAVINNANVGLYGLRVGGVKLKITREAGL